MQTEGDRLRPPAFQLYADDFLAGTADMTAEEVGVYIRLLCHSWSKEGLEDNDRLALLAGQCQASSLAHAKTKFRMIDGKLKNARQEEERGKQAEFRAKQAENGKKRWVGNAKPDAKPPGLGQPPSPSPSPITNTPTPLPPPASQDGGDLILVAPSDPPPAQPSALQVRLGRIFHRRPNTRWSRKELKALREIGTPDEEDLERLEAYYSARIPKDSDYRRTSLLVLLNHFTGELDRARKFKAPSCF